MSNLLSVHSINVAQSLLVAYGSVRARAERLCVQLGVGDAAAAVNSFCGVGIDKTLSIAVYPSGMQKNGTSGTCLSSAMPYTL